MTEHRPRQPEQPLEPGQSPPVVDAYFDARGQGRSAKSILDEVVRDASVLDDLARDREWIDEVRASRPAPDQTLFILGRLGLDPDQFDGRRHRFTVLTRRLATAAVLMFAFVLGMWVRSARVMPAQAQPLRTADRFERVIESLPIQTDPFDRVRMMMLQVGTTLAEPDAQDAQPARRIRLHDSHPATTRLPGRTTREDGPAPQSDSNGFIDHEIDAESLKALYKDLGIV